jgi:hypothetical protein
MRGCYGSQLMITAVHMEPMGSNSIFNLCFKDFFYLLRLTDSWYFSRRQICLDFLRKLQVICAKNWFFKLKAFITLRQALLLKENNNISKFESLLVRVNFARWKLHECAVGKWCTLPNQTFCPNWPILLTEYPYSECTGPAQIYKKVINVRAWTFTYFYLRFGSGQ